MLEVNEIEDVRVRRLADELQHRRLVLGFRSVTPVLPHADLDSDTMPMPGIWGRPVHDALRPIGDGLIIQGVLNAAEQSDFVRPQRVRYFDRVHCVW